MSTHAKLSPSSAHRWLRCPASVGFVDQLRAEGKIPAQERSAFTDEGTVAHEFAAKALEHFDAGLDFDWDSIPDAVMRSHVRAYYDLVTSKVTGDGQLYIEHRMPLFYGYRGDPERQVLIRENRAGGFNVEPEDGRWYNAFATYDDAKAYFEEHLAPQGYWIEECGTSDAIVLTDEGLFVLDLKYGEGVSVSAEDNDQLAIYAESFIREQNLRQKAMPEFPVTAIIFQPRAREGAPVREWLTSLGELSEKGTQMGAVARQIANQGDERVKRVEFSPGDKQCRFCPARKLCKHYADHCTLDVKWEFETTVETGQMPPEINELSENDIARIAKVAIDGKFVKWLNAVADYALELRLAGKLADSGLKAVYSSPRRQWTDEDAAAKLLRNYLSIDEAMPRSIVSPSQAEELLKSHEVSTKFENKMRALITKPQGQPTLALESDKREEVKTLTAATEFANEEDDLL